MAALRAGTAVALRLCGKPTPQRDSTYTNRKQEYVTKFVQFLDWQEINARWQSLAG
jgi:hypothetical protein